MTGESVAVAKPPARFPSFVGFDVIVGAMYVIGPKSRRPFSDFHSWSLSSHYIRVVAVHLHQSGERERQL